MADRLSESSGRSVYESGQQAYLRSPSRRKPSSFWLSKPDLKGILREKNPRKAIQSLSPQSLYFALSEQGLGDSLDVLPLLSDEQFVRICDYDVWRDDRLATKQLFTWLAWYREISPAQMFKRFVSLDEEYQIASLSPFIAVFTEEDYERMSDEQQDQLQRFPGDAMYYHVRTGDPELHKGICDLIDAAMSKDMGYAMALVSHCGYAVPNEHEHMMSQFRKARLEEDGFVSYEESLECFRPQKPSARSEAVSFDKPSDDLPALAQDERPFLEQVLECAAKTMSAESLSGIQSGLLALANSLCTATKAEPGDLAGLRDTFEHAQGMVSLALAFESGGNPEAGVQILNSAYPKALFRTGLGYVHDLRMSVLKGLEKAGVPGVSGIREQYLQMKFAGTLNAFDSISGHVLSFEQTEIFKGLFNRFPLCPREHVSYRDEELKRLSFSPLGSSADFVSLVRHLESVFALLTLANLGSEQTFSESVELSLEEALSRGVMRGLMRQSFRTEALSQEELHQFSQADSEELVKGCSDFLTASRMMLEQTNSLLAEASADGDLVSGLMSKKSGSDMALLHLEQLSQTLVQSRQEPYSFLNSQVKKLSELTDQTTSV